MTKPVTPESLRHDRDKRYREREQIAKDYDSAADALEEMVGCNFKGVINHLRMEAANWRRIR